MITYISVVMIVLSLIQHVDNVDCQNQKNELISLFELTYQVEVIFQGKFCSEMKEAALNLTKSLAQVAQEILVDFEEAVVKDSSKTNMQNGTVHPFTIEVITYVKSLLE